MARPVEYRADFHPNSFIELSREGMCLTEIAAEWDCGRNTIYAWADRFPEFSNAIKIGKELCEAWYLRKGKDFMEKPSGSCNPTIYIWLTKNIFKWTDRVETVEPKRPLKDLTDEELDAL